MQRFIQTDLWYSRVVLDMGSCETKAGLCNDFKPFATESAIMGRHSNFFPSVCMSNRRDLYCGYRAIELGSILTLERPIQRGIVRNWDGYEALLFSHFYNSTRSSPEDTEVVMPCYPYNPHINEFKISEMLFETFNIQKLLLSVIEYPLLEFYLGGIGSTGILVDCGGGVLRIYPIYKGILLTYAIGRWDFGGEDITSFLKQLLSPKYNFQTSEESIILANNIKKEKSFISQNFNSDFREYKENNITQPFTLPDGSILELGSEIFEASEAYFQPYLFGNSFIGIHKAVYDTITKCDIEIRSELFENIILTGGSIIKGMDIRLKFEIANLIKSENINVKILPESKYSAFTASSYLGRLEIMQDRFFTSQEYAEYGPYIHTKLG